MEVSRVAGEAGYMAVDVLDILQGAYPQLNKDAAAFARGGLHLTLPLVLQELCDTCARRYSQHFYL